MLITHTLCPEMSWLIHDYLVTLRVMQSLAYNPHGLVHEVTVNYTAQSLCPRALKRKQAWNVHRAGLPERI